MSSIPNNALAQPVDRRRQNIFNALLRLSTLLIGGLIAVPANAGAFLITTTGTITSGSETGGLFGLPDATTSLVGYTYTLTAGYDSPGPNYVIGAGVAADLETLPGISGYVTATLNGTSLTTPLVNSLSVTLEETLAAGFGAFYGSNNGYDSVDTTGAFTSVTQALTCGSANNCVPAADLLTPFFYSVVAGDSASDQYAFDCAGFPSCTPAASFAGTETSMNFQVPEPESWVLLATGLLGLRTLTRKTA